MMEDSVLSSDSVHVFFMVASGMLMHFCLCFAWAWVHVVLLLARTVASPAKHEQKMRGQIEEVEDYTKYDMIRYL